MVSPPYIRCWNKRATHFCGDFSRKAETKHEAQFPSSFKHLTWCGSSLSIEQDLGWRTVLCQCPCLLPTPVGPCLLLQPARTSKNQWAQLQGVDWHLSQAASALLGLPHPHGHLSVGTHGDSAALPSMGAGGGRCGGELDRPCREPARSNNFPALCKRQSCGLNMLLCRGKKIPMQYKEINTDINTNNPISFVLTAW